MDAEIVWQDREIRFDVRPTLLNCYKVEGVFCLLLEDGQLCRGVEF